MDHRQGEGLPSPGSLGIYREEGLGVRSPRVSDPLEKSREGAAASISLVGRSPSPVAYKVPPTSIPHGSADPTLRTEGQGHLSPRSRELSPREAQGVAGGVRAWERDSGSGASPPPHAAHTPSLPAPADPGPALPLPLVPLRSVS